MNQEETALAIEYFIDKLREEIRTAEISYYQCYRCCIVMGWDHGIVRKLLLNLRHKNISMGAKRMYIRIFLIKKLKSHQHNEDRQGTKLEVVR